MQAPNADLTYFASVALAIFLEAAPFLLLGSLLASLIQVAMPDDFLQRRAPRGVALQILAGLGAGFLLPTCECGVVPVVRRLLDRGAPPASAVAFLLAAPVVNPVVLVSTWVAFQGDWRMVAGRVGLVVLPATVLGWAVSRVDPSQLLRHGGMHSHSHGSVCGCGHHHGSGFHLGPFLAHAASEFLDMGRFLILGAVAAALFKTFTPSAAVAFFQDNVFLAVGAMMLLAVLLSVCSEADAFVAASFHTFPKAAQLAFMGLGPMVDLKLIPMFFAVFHRRVATALVVVPVFLVWFLSTLLGVMGMAGTGVLG